MVNIGNFILYINIFIKQNQVQTEYFGEIDNKIGITPISVLLIAGPIQDDIAKDEKNNTKTGESILLFCKYHKMFIFMSEFRHIGKVSLFGIFSVALRRSFYGSERKESD